MEKKTASSITLGKTLSLSLVLLLLTAGYFPIASTHNAPFPSGYDPTAMTMDTIGEPQSLDPAWAYDTASSEIIFNVYETMLFYDVAWTDGPYAAGKVDQFKPLLATSWAWTSGPAPYVKTITFTVRTGVTFHNGNPLTSADVEYSWERLMVQDRSGGPQWMFYYPLMGTYGADDPASDPNFGDKINNAITRTADTVSIHLLTDFPETTFLQIMCQPWVGVVEKSWAVGLGDFDGNWAAGWETIYNTWHDPSISFIEGQMMGTGPYKFDYWEQGVSYSIVKNDAYWDGWPARVYRQPSSDNERIGGFISRATWYLLTSWTTRRSRFLAGDVDSTIVPRQYINEILGQIVGGEPVRCFYPLSPQITVDANCFTFDINPQSPYLGPGFDPANPATIAEDRIPTNLFSDIHMRRGFRYAFDFNLFLSSAYLGEATQPADPIVSGLSYDNVANALPVYDLTKAVEELKAAWVGGSGDNPGTPEGSIWDNGMTFTLLYNSGNVARETAVTMLANNINAMNPKFHLSIQEVPLSGTYVPQMIAHMLPLFSSGPYKFDYLDPDNSAFPFMHTYGTFSLFQSYSNPRVDELIEAGAFMSDDTLPYSGQLDQPDLASLIAVFNNYPNIPPDTRWPRRSIYYELQALYTDDVPGFCLDQPVGRHFEQAWMRGWYYNPLYPGEYIYHRWKAVTHFGDANNDGAVNVLDGGFVSGHRTDIKFSPFPYNPAADLTGGSGGTPDGGVGRVVGIPDGKVDGWDVALVQLYFDGPPPGGPIYDVAVDYVEPSTEQAFAGEDINLNVSVTNDGTQEESFQVNLYYDSSLIGTLDVNNLAPYTSTTLNFTWMTLNVPPGDYTIKAIADTVAGETDTADNTFTNGIVTIKKPEVMVDLPAQITQTFSANITIVGVQDLYTWQAGLTFNASVLEVLSISEGEFLKTAGVPTLWTPGSINNTIGKIGYSACSITGPNPGVNGSGQLMSVTFSVKTGGNSSLHLTDVLVLDSDLAPIELGGLVDGYVQVPTQDVAILNVTSSAIEAYPTWILPINITVVVENQGMLTETFNVTAYANVTWLGTQSVALSPGASTTVVFIWNVTGAAEGTYAIRAEATVLYSEIDTADNYLTNGTVRIKHPGDANGDSILNAYDLGILAKAFGTMVGDPLFDPRADFNGDLIINTLDHDILKAHWP